MLLLSYKITWFGSSIVYDKVGSQQFKKKMAQKLGIVLNFYWTLHTSDIFNTELALPRFNLPLILNFSYLIAIINIRSFRVPSIVTQWKSAGLSKL